MTDLMEWRTKPARKNEEETLQRAIVQHLRLMAHPDAVYLHIPNGMHTSKRTGARMKAMGTLPGAPDLLFLTKDGTFAMELKRPGGRMSPEQKVFQQRCEVIGVPHAVVADLDTAINILIGWGILPA